MLALAAAGSAALFLVATLIIRQPVLFPPRWAGHAHAEPDRLRGDVTALAFLPRDDHAAAYIANAFRLAGARVEEQPFEARGRMYRNVIAHFGPDDPSKPLLIIGAHYDVMRETNDANPGADDNASGTAGLLELARLLSAERLTRPVDLVAYANEEPPFFGSQEMGSAIHAASLGKRPIHGMISLEMIGYFTREQTWASPVLEAMYGPRGDFIAVVGGWDDRGLVRATKSAMLSQAGVRVVSAIGPHEMSDASDQRNYWSRGIPAIMITDTAYLRNPNYHTARDRPDTLDYDRMASVVDGVVNAVVVGGGGGN